MCSDSSHYGQNCQTRLTLIRPHHWCVRSDSESSGLVTWSLSQSWTADTTVNEVSVWKHPNKQRTAVGGACSREGGAAQDWRMDRREEGMMSSAHNRQKEGILKWSVTMQLPVKRWVGQSCNRSGSRCVKRQDEYATCPNVAASRRSAVGNDKCAEPVCRVLLHSSHACVAQRMQPVLPCTLESVILCNSRVIFGSRAKNSVNVLLKTH